MTMDAMTMDDSRCVMANVGWYYTSRARSPRQPRAHASRRKRRLVSFGGKRTRAAVAFQPLAAETYGFVRRQPGPIGAAGAHRDPDGVAMDVFFHGQLVRVGHAG